MNFCLHKHLSVPFADERGLAYKVCLGCSGRIEAPLWDRLAPGLVPPHRTQDRKLRTEPLTGIEKREFGIR